MPKITIPNKCVKCGSENIRTEELAMSRKHGALGGKRGYIFNVYICEECGYSELYFKERTVWV